MSAAHSHSPEAIVGDVKTETLWSVRKSHALRLAEQPAPWVGPARQRAYLARQRSQEKAEAQMFSVLEGASCIMRPGGMVGIKVFLQRGMQPWAP